MKHHDMTTNNGRETLTISIQMTGEPFSIETSAPYFFLAFRERIALGLLPTPPGGQHHLHMSTDWPLSVVDWQSGELIPVRDLPERMDVDAYIASAEEALAQIDTEETC